LGHAGLGSFSKPLRTPEQNATFVQQANRHQQQQLESALEELGIETGLSVGLIDRVESVEEIIERAAREYLEIGRLLPGATLAELES